MGEMENDLPNSDICRVCRSEGQPDRPLFHPCICTGSIKWIHQECLVQWMRYSRKEYCELCSYRFSFTPIYSPDMPRRLPVKDLAAGLLSSICTAIKYWLHYTLVAVAWLGIVPLTACRIYRALFNGTIDALLILPFELFSMDNVATDIFHGCFVVTCTLFAFAGLVWLREQILHGGGPDWLQRDQQIIEDPQQQLQQMNPQQPQPAQQQQQQQQEQQQQQQQPQPIQQQPADDVDVRQDDNNDDNNWIPMEWDRAAEEITWERLLGLDGSLMFLEHVFWVISLNTLFILIFAYSPYHMGLLTLNVLKIPTGNTQHFQGLLTTLIGYCTVGLLFVFFHKFACFLGFIKAKCILGLCYVVVKVAMLLVVEIGIVPLVCGWWLDICSLLLFDATIKERENSFRLAPGTSIFIHWLIGMVYVYYFASFILLLREILRPGVLWFLRNFNDPDFSPIQEMIHLPIIEHIRKFLITAVVFGSAVLLMLYIPIRLLKYLWPTFLPYTVSLNNENHVSELSLELLLLQVILPALLEQSHTRIWLKMFVRNWCRFISWLLNIHSYLLGDNNGNNSGSNNNNNNNNNDQQPPQPQPQPQPQPNEGGLGAVHQALLMMEPPIGYQPYTRPKFFILRLIGLLIFICISLIISSLIALTLPVWLGRRVMKIWLVGGTPPAPQIQIQTTLSATHQQPATEIKVHELYTAACGLYLCWLTARAITLITNWLPQGRKAILSRVKQWISVGIKTLVASILLLGIIPLLFGLLLELVIIIPLRVPVHQTPIFFIWQDWALGVLYTKIACAIIMMGPDWFIRRAIERAYRDGIREMQLNYIIQELAAPVIASSGLALSIPYVINYSIIPLVIDNIQLRNIIIRRLYPTILFIGVISGVVVLQIRQFKKLYEHIKNDKYLVGQRLVNYDHQQQQQHHQQQTKDKEKKN